MAVYTGNPSFSATLLPGDVAESLVPVNAPDPTLEPLFDAVFQGVSTLYSGPRGTLPFRHLLLTEFSVRSQYDQLIELVRGGIQLPDRLACLAGSGLDFHGFKGRSWAAVPGNLHLAVHLAPDRPLARFGPAFTALATLSVVDALDEIPGLEGRASIKWVNDILLSGAKVAGSLAFTQSQDLTVSSAIIGIGLNVEVAPVVSRDHSVPQVGSVRELLPKAVEAPRLQTSLLLGLLRSLENNYLTLLEDGAAPLIQRYQARSAVIGENVIVYPDSTDRGQEVLARGRVVDLGDNLELFLEGRSEPITGGRIIIKRDGDDIDPGAQEITCGAMARSFFEGPPS